jgi:hypothetical protein
MTTYRKLLYPSILIPLVTGYLMISHMTKAATGPLSNSAEISTLLSEAKAEALELRDDADHMETFTRSKVSWQGFVGKINEVRHHINKTGELLAKLQKARDTGSSWQQQAIDHITPSLQELASNTESAIQYLSNNSKRVHTKELENYCHVNSDLATRLSALVGDFIDYGESKARLAELQRKVDAH